MPLPLQLCEMFQSHWVIFSNNSGRVYVGEGCYYILGVIFMKIFLANFPPKFRLDKKTAQFATNNCTVFVIGNFRNDESFWCAKNGFFFVITFKGWGFRGYGVLLLLNRFFNGMGIANKTTNSRVWLNWKQLDN